MPYYVNIDTGELDYTQSAAGLGAIDQITADSGTLSPVGGNINIIGGSGIDTSGSGDTLTISVEADVAQSFATDSGTATPALGILNIIGGSGVDVSASGNTVTIGSEPDIPQSFITDSGTATPSLGILHMVGGVGTTTTGSGSAVTLNLDVPVSVANGGTGASVLTGVLTGNGAAPITATPITQYAPIIGGASSAVASVAIGTAGQVLQSAGAGVAAAYSTATYPATTTIHQLLYSSAANTVVGLATANSAVLTTTSAGVPVATALATNGQLLIGNAGGTPTAALPTSTGGNYIAGAGSLKYIPANYTPGCSNIGIAYSGGTFTVQGYDGTALSATNPGYVTLQSKGTPGRFVTIAVTANQTFTDGSSGTMDNARFGVTTGVNWANDMPFFLYGVMDDTEALINFMVSRHPCATVSPVNTSISKTGAIVNVGQGDFFSLGDITVTAYDQNPCICLGSFRMQFAGASDSWTVQTLNTTDGIGNFNDNTTFTFPSGQNGAASGTYILSNAGTEPVWTTNAMTYNIARDGLVYYVFDGQTPSTTGVGANTLQPVLPYATCSVRQYPSVMGRYTSSTSQFAVIIAIGTSQSFVATIHLNGGTATFTNAAITVASTNYLQFHAHYYAFTPTGI